MSSDSNFNEKHLNYWVALSCFPKFGPVRFKKIISYFPSMKSAWQASLIELESAGIDYNTATEFIQERSKINPDAETEKLMAENIKIVTIQDIDYPALLKEMPDAPPLLYYKGNLNCVKQFCLSVVGSRKYTSYGKQAVEKLVSQLAEVGMTIVSGLALGIDALAHESALQVNGSTAAILGSGINQSSIYPRANVNLAARILAQDGLLLTEFPYGTPALKHHFPQRNRIVAGLSLGTLIIEATEKSGALITARLALDYNREVFAVPGSIFSTNSQGTNKLIQKNGAQLANSADTILETLAIENIQASKQVQKIIPDNPTELQLMEILNHEPVHINTLARLTKLDTATINATLITMELKGYARNMDGGNYVLS
ncbi:MAG: DNA-processing protein DprA [Candidatus Falkowbacteria bacterium]